MIKNNNLSTSPKKNISRIRKRAKVCQEIALEILNAVSQRKPADRELEKFFRSRKELGARDRKSISDLIFSIFRWWGWIRIWKNTDMDRMFLAAMVLEGQINSPVVEEWSRRVKPTVIWPKLFVSFSLNEKALLIDNLLGPFNHKRYPRDLFPDWFLDELHIPIDGSNERGFFLYKLLSILQTRPPVWIRFQERDADMVLKELESAGLIIHLHSKLKTAASIHSKINLNIIPCYGDGKFQVQDLSSQMVGIACSPQPGEDWWDVCAGGGGKSLHLAALMKGRGKIWATDVRDIALMELRRRIKKTKFRNISTQLIKNSSNDLKCNFSKLWKEDILFDGILVDAPCSGMGTWRRNPDARWRTKKADINRYSKIQINLLNSCADRVRPGGTLIYSVCSLIEAETLRIIELFIKSNGTFYLSSFPDLLEEGKDPGIIWIWPQTDNSDGMFIARFQKQY